MTLLNRMVAIALQGTIYAGLVLTAMQAARPALGYWLFDCGRNGHGGTNLLLLVSAAGKV